MLFSEARHRKIVSTTTADTVGRVDELLVDPQRHAILAINVGKADRGDTLRWQDLSAFGVDAVTVSDAEQISEADDEVKALSGKNHRIMGKRVLTTHGDELGSVADVEFEPSSGVITAIQLDGQQVEGVRLVGIGSYAVVVHPTD